MDVVLILVVMVPQLVLLYLMYKIYNIGKKIYRDIKPHIANSPMSFLGAFTPEDLKDMIQIVKRFV